MPRKRQESAGKNGDDETAAAINDRLRELFVCDESYTYSVRRRHCCGEP